MAEVDVSILRELQQAIDRGYNAQLIPYTILRLTDAIEALNAHLNEKLDHIACLIVDPET